MFFAELVNLQRSLAKVTDITTQLVSTLTHTMQLSIIIIILIYILISDVMYVINVIKC